MIMFFLLRVLEQKFNMLFLWENPSSISTVLIRILYFNILIILACNVEDGQYDGRALKEMIFGQIRIKKLRMLVQYSMLSRISKNKIM